MDKHILRPTPSAPAAKKIYVTLVGATPMPSLDALMISLDKFKTMLSSDSARTRFDTTIRSIQTTLAGVHAFIDKVYAEKNPTMAVTMKGRTLVIEISMTENEFLECVQDYDIDEILKHITAVGSMPAQKTTPQKLRDYTVFPVKYESGRFTKVAKAF